MTELRECPFCGSKKIGIYEWAMYDWVAQCDYCHSSGMYAATPEDAAKAWNTRKEDRKKRCLNIMQTTGSLPEL